MNLPENGGSYCIVFEVDSLSFITRGKRKFSLKEGTYVYVGSAFGAGGLRKRILRHLKRKKSKHWHFDFVTTHSSFKPLEVWLFEGQKVECELASLVGKVAEPVNGFGSTDCSCPSHLFKVEDISLLKRMVRSSFNVKILKVFDEGVENGSKSCS
ncbi:GIY-YIG nuclease family protein [Phorcysia thermohydrogeniphila]|uniref:Uri superfamily endonuclease n=1 Tax=Phorcysia thermohydrogeniphila TaxID=936138 RepID=A0A4V6NCZ5_9BACT|nr:GIY-YIG nuclease family protein [Phorcysia thermohydrogeniphila]TCK06286.1 Uri superfamily endonuclease [Phorcysia thermohydrogeniphila]